MFPRDTLKGYKVKSLVPLTNSPTVRITRIIVNNVEKVNPWTPIHDGTVHNEATLITWENIIPKYCNCVASYESYKLENPPDFSSHRKLWLWGFHLHNWVNNKLGKPELTLKDALSLWKPIWVHDS